MRLMVLAAALAAFAGPAFAGEWREIGNSDEYILGVDQSQIRRTGNLATVWAIQSSREGYRVTRMEVDCRNETLTSLTYTEFNNGGGVVMSDHRRGRTEIVYPDSTGATLMKAGCEADTFFSSARHQTPSAFHRMAVSRLSAE